MIVMMTAITPSVKASSRPLVMRCASPFAAAEYVPGTSGAQARRLRVVTCADRLHRELTHALQQAAGFRRVPGICFWLRLAPENRIAGAGRQAELASGGKRV